MAQVGIWCAWVVTLFFQHYFINADLEVFGKNWRSAAKRLLEVGIEILNGVT